MRGTFDIFRKNIRSEGLTNATMEPRSALINYEACQFIVHVELQLRGPNIKKASTKINFRNIEFCELFPRRCCKNKTYVNVIKEAQGFIQRGGGGGGCPGISPPQRKFPPPPPPRILKAYVQFYMALWYWVTFLGVLTIFHFNM